MSVDLDFDTIQDLMIRGELSGSAAEVHGHLSGMLCMDTATDPAQWLEDFFGDETPQEGEYDRETFEALYRQTRRQLTDPDFSFQPLLPDDQESLDSRALALGEWCHGFLQGLGYSGETSEWPGESNEILRDFLEIVRLDVQTAEDADEEAYAELTEYVRVGVQVIQSELDAMTPEGRH
ncbi:MAG: hypothetical protein RLZZ627_636 [Pseudomonadota bacterium]